MTIKRAREILRERAETITDKEIDKLLQTLVIIVNKAIDEAVEK